MFALDERHEASLEDASAYGTKLTCEPMVGRIAPGQTRVLEVTLCNPVPGKHRLELVARLRGGEPLKIPCRRAVVPDVRASPAALALEAVLRRELEARRRDASERLRGVRVAQVRPAAAPGV